jgi:hypothetical protein
MSELDDPFGDDPEQKEFAEALERHRAALFELISDYMEDAELDVGTAVHLLIGAMVGMRMSDYGMSVASPSAAGLKTDLDRLQGEVDDYLRQAKKGAEKYIERVKEVLAAAAAEEEGAEDKEEGDPE